MAVNLIRIPRTLNFASIATHPTSTRPALLAWAERLDRVAGAGKPCFFLLDFELRRPVLLEKHEFPASGIRFSFPGRPEPAPRDRPGLNFALDVIPPTEVEYLKAFEIVQSGLRRGDSFLTNLTFAIPIAARVGLGELYHGSEAKYRVWLPGEFVSFSPETFVTVDESGYIESRPMKGTALDTPEEIEALLNSPKEIAEHATIVDLIRNDLSQVARRVRVTDYRYLRAISHRGLVQTSSKIGGQLPDDWKSRLGQIMLDLLPAGSVSGAPKPATLDLIRRAEAGPRGYYCGVAGYFDGRRLDTCVLIRFVEQAGAGKLRFRSGGGVTARSSWEDEYEELLQKVRVPVRRR